MHSAAKKSRCSDASTGEGLHIHYKWLMMLSLMLFLFVNMMSVRSAAADENLVVYEEKTVQKRYQKRLAQYPASKQNRGKILLAGSSSMWIWGNTEDNPLSAFHPLNMAIPGSVSGNWLKWYKKAIVSYKPKVVVLYVGVNDGIYTKARARKTARNVKKLLGLIKKKLPDTQIYYISVVTPPGRQKRFPDTLRYTSYANKQIRKFCKGRKGITYIAIDDRFRKNGKVKASLFRNDGTHPNRQGLNIWNQYVGKRIARAAANIELNVQPVSCTGTAQTITEDPVLQADPELEI